jgi:riboflavin kinase/FMN adenylyltransferase
MQIFRHYEQVPESARGATVAIGNFDGVHKGHQALLQHAKAQGGKLGVLVFEPHPQEFFKPDTPRFRLTPFRAKARLLEQHGVSLLFALHFNAEFASLSADEFITKVLVQGLGVRHVIVGEDFCFGKGRQGNLALLQQRGAELGFGVTTFELVGEGEASKISSTSIREALRDGKPDVAAALLGHPWTVEGRVEGGDRRGRTIGFPTANVSLEGYLEPALGVYAVRVEVGGGKYGGVANFGRRPTFDKKDVLLEVHIFDFEGDIYGQPIVVSFISFLRPEMKFAGLDALKAQIAKDSVTARALLQKNP